MKKKIATLNNARLPLKAVICHRITKGNTPQAIRCRAVKLIKKERFKNVKKMSTRSVLRNNATSNFV